MSIGTRQPCSRVTFTFPNPELLEPLSTHQQNYLMHTCRRPRLDIVGEGVAFAATEPAEPSLGRMPTASSTAVASASSDDSVAVSASTRALFWILRSEVSRAAIGGKGAEGWKGGIGARDQLNEKDKCIVSSAWSFSFSPMYTGVGISLFLIHFSQRIYFPVDSWFLHPWFHVNLKSSQPALTLHTCKELPQKWSTATRQNRAQSTTLTDSDSLSYPLTWFIIKLFLVDQWHTSIKRQKCRSVGQKHRPPYLFL